jgi:hypothetical protein
VAGLRSGTADLTLPWNWYSDPRTQPREQERIFRQVWHYWGPLVFVNPDSDAAPLADTLGPVPEHVAGGGIDVDGLRFFRRTELDVACNWKIAVENYLECYQCAVAHPGFSAVVDVRPETCKLETQSLGSSQFGPTKGEAGAVEGQFHWLWPVTKPESERLLAHFQELVRRALA